jgi:hypothetical protein
MLVDFYAREDVFAPVPKLAQEIDPVLRKLDSLLDDDALYQQVRADFGKRYRFTLVHGRHSTPVEVLLRMLILKHLYQWSYKEWVLLLKMVDKSTSSLQTHFGPVFGDEAVQIGHLTLK